MATNCPSWNDREYDLLKKMAGSTFNFADGQFPLLNPTFLPNLRAWYDVSNASSMVVDGSNRVQLIADVSGNSAENALVLNGVAGNYASSPDSAAVSAPNVLDVMFDVTPVNVATGASQIAIGQFLTAGNQRSWYFGFSTTGAVRFSGSSDGITAVAADSTVVWPYAVLVRAQCRITWAGSTTGDVNFYTRTGTSGAWTQLGATVAGPVGPRHNSTASLTMGSDGAGTGLLFNGLIHRTAVATAIDGAYVFDANFTAQSKLATSFTESSVNAATVTINTTGDLGARISGARDLIQMTASKQPTYLAWAGSNYGWLNGVANNTFFAPDSAAVSILGDIDLRADIAASDYTPSATQSLIAKFRGDTNQRSYMMQILSTGLVRLVTNPVGNSGAANVVFDSTVAPTVTDFSRIQIRATLDVDDGAGNKTATFYTRTDGDISSSSGWTQLGTAVTTAGTTSIFDGTEVLNIGSNTTGGLELFSGSIFRAQIYNGIAGTLAFDFNPAAYTSGTTFLDSSVNAATITINGGATVVTRTGFYTDGSDDYNRSPLYSGAQPVTRFTVASQSSWTSGDYLWDGASAANAGAIIQTTSTPQINMSAGSSVAANTTLALKTRSIVTEVINGASSSLQVNNATATTGSAGANNPNGSTLGASGASTAANFGNLVIQERIEYAGAMTAAQIAAVKLYLARKWGLSL
jgi:hypothetical protein